MIPGLVSAPGYIYIFFLMFLRSAKKQPTLSQTVSPLGVQPTVLSFSDTTDTDVTLLEGNTSLLFMMMKISSPVSMNFAPHRALLKDPKIASKGHQWYQ